MVSRTIIVPLDGSDFAERALSAAGAIARCIDARLILMSTHWEGNADGAAAYLERVAKEQAELETEVLLVDEHPAAQAIASVARSHPGSTVCMTSHGRRPVRWAILGSVAEEVVRESGEPVLLVGSHCSTEWSTRGPESGSARP